MQNRVSYWFLLLAITVLVILSLGGGLWGAEQSIGHWTGKLFEQICHQDPMRSYRLNEVPMAVNSRCFGIFLGLWVGWLSIPFLIHAKFEKYWRNRVLFLAVMLQIIDYMGNHILWENTNATRAVLGFILGAAVTLFLSDLFQSKK